MGTPVIVGGRSDADRCGAAGCCPGCTPPSCSASHSAGCWTRAGLAPELVEQVIGGCVTQAGEQSNTSPGPPGCTPG